MWAPPLLCLSPAGRGWVLGQREEQARDEDIGRQRGVGAAGQGTVRPAPSCGFWVSGLDSQVGKGGVGALLPNPRLKPAETR